MKAAIAHGKRPSVMVLGEGSNKKPPKSIKGLLRALHDDTVYTRTDITLAKAYQRFLSELCSQCGQPKYVCHTDDNRIQVDLKRDECSIMAKVERARAENSKKDNPEYGVQFYGDPYLVDRAKEEGLEISDFRTPYFEDRARKAGILPPKNPSPVSGN